MTHPIPSYLIEVRLTQETRRLALNAGRYWMIQTRNSGEGVVRKNRRPGRTQALLRRFGRGSLNAEPRIDRGATMSDSGLAGHDRRPPESRVASRAGALR
jgi:hypothetical protein